MNLINFQRDTDIHGYPAPGLANTILSIEVYKSGNAWLFDDARVGLVGEAFVAGADTLIDKFAGVHERITVLFSDKWFPDHQIVVDKKEVQDVLSGTEYYCEVMQHHLWLCSALNLYYPVSPEKIYVKFII